MKKLSDCTVLIVDDTEENVDLLVEALGEDYDLSVTMDGSAALEYVKSELPDIILLDIMMPNISGYEVCAELKKDSRTAEIPIIFLSAMTDIESKKRGFELGAVDYITKPFNVYEVQARVNTHLSLMLVKQELSMQNVILEKTLSTVRGSWRSRRKRRLKPSHTWWNTAIRKRAATSSAPRTMCGYWPRSCRKTPSISPSSPMR
ncbi:MAG TPA: response regulator [Candidatus Limiplasma sp.]|nr:response regulator [Candidatus Limiplasma sp.]